MTPKVFKHWRKGVMRMSQKEAAEALGLKRRVVQYYEKGERDGDSIDIPKAVRLACFALSQGVTDYQAPESEGRSQGPQADGRAASPDPTAGTQPAPDAAAGKKKRKKADTANPPATDPAASANTSAADTDGDPSASV